MIIEEWMESLGAIAAARQDRVFPGLFDEGRYPFLGGGVFLSPVQLSYSSPWFIRFFFVGSPLGP